MVALQIGCGRADITPPVGLPLSGFIFQTNRPSVAVADPLLVHTPGRPTQPVPVETGAEYCAPARPSSAR